MQSVWRLDQGSPLRGGCPVWTRRLATRHEAERGTGALEWKQNTMSESDITVVSAAIHPLSVADQGLPLGTLGGRVCIWWKGREGVE